MSATALIRFCDEAREVAMEHIAWCLQNGYGLGEVGRSIGAEPGEIQNIDDALFAVAGAWLRIDREVMPR